MTPTFLQTTKWPRPLPKGPASGLDRRIHVGRIGRVAAAEDRFGGRIHRLEGLASPTGDPRPVDEQTVAIGDLDRSGLPDVVAGLSSSGLIQLWDPGAAVPEEPVRYVSSDGATMQMVALEDWNADGWLDVVSVASGEAPRVTLYSAGQGALEASVYVGTAADPVALEMADLNADGRRELALLTENQGVIVYRAGVTEEGAPTASTGAGSQRRPACAESMYTDAQRMRRTCMRTAC